MQLFRLVPGKSLCLASVSARRKALLAATGLEFLSLDSEFSETEPLSKESAPEYTQRMANGKAGAAYSLLSKRDSAPPVVIACDTIVCKDGIILGKPASMAGLMAMLNKLNGASHQVFTATCIRGAEFASVHFVECTEVKFADWPVGTLEAYALAYKPLDKAGSYGIQDGGGFLVESIQGSWTNVVGLPLAQILKALLERSIIAPAYR